MRGDDCPKRIGRSVLRADIGIAAEEVVTVQIGRIKAIIRSLRRCAEAIALGLITRSVDARVTEITRLQARNCPQQREGNREDRRCEFANIG